MRLVQGQMGRVLADYADRFDQSDNRSRHRRRQARVRGDDGDDKDRHRRNRKGAPRLSLFVSNGICLRLGYEDNVTIYVAHPVMSNDIKLFPNLKLTVS